MQQQNIIHIVELCLHTKMHLLLYNVFRNKLYNQRHTRKDSAKFYCMVKWNWANTDLNTIYFQEILDAFKFFG